MSYNQSLIALGAILIAKKCLDIKEGTNNIKIFYNYTEEDIKELLASHKRAYTLEEHSIIGGLFSLVAEIKAQTDIRTPVTPIGGNDTFGESGKMNDVLKKFGLTADHIKEVVNG